MMGLNIESKVSFPHNTFQTEEEGYRGGNTVAKAGGAAGSDE